ncbi:MAG: aminotransferase class V-fold PLP-dependent enzyme [Gemmatales bacterium]|nr:aminotransferase class V-fold PLP-dependent enzyme [Gemmatales bacterium]MDW7994990.1 aminotransferase class V-fold PLP-dependent enzyme [Gemmatales bacterium]
MTPSAAPDWQGFREQFPVTQRWAFFDHAAVSPISRAAHAALCAWADDVLYNGEVNEPTWDREIENIRGLAAQLLDAEPDCIAFIKNTSEGIGFVAEGYPWQPGDNVVIPADEYPSNVYPWQNLAARGVEVRFVPSRAGRVLLDDIRAAMNSRTRLLAVSFVEFATGFRLPLADLAEICHARGVHLFVDAIQGLGAIPLSVREVPVDFLAAGSHKWLLGPVGAGIFYLRQDLLDFLRPVSVGWKSVVRHWDFTTLDFRLKPSALRWENGTLSAGVLLALGAALRLLLQMGIARIWQRIEVLTDSLCQQLEAGGWQVFSSRLPQEKSGIVSVVPKNQPAKQLVRLARQMGIVINHRAARLRISPHAYNNEDELTRLIEFLQRADA